MFTLNLSTYGPPHVVGITCCPCPAGDHGPAQHDRASGSKAQSLFLLHSRIPRWKPSQCGGGSQTKEVGRKEIAEDKVPAETTYIWLGQTEELNGELGLGAQGKGQEKGGC